MVKIRKVISVLLAVVMLCACVVVSAGAYSYSPTYTTGKFKVITQADKTTVKPGDVVTLSLIIDPGDKSDLGAGGYVVNYNSAQLTPCDAEGNPTNSNTAFRTWQNSAAVWNKDEATVNFTMSPTAFTSFTAEEKAYFDKAIMIAGQVDSIGGQVNTVGNGWNPVAGETVLTYTMKVSDSVAPGEVIWVGLHQAGFTRGTTYFMQCGGTRFANTEYDLTNSMTYLTVASDEPAGPVVAKSKSEVKMTPNSATTVEDAFQFRVTSVITDADWDTYFANTEAGGNNAITKLGFVAYKGTDGFNMDTAKAVAMGTTTDANYDVATTDYVQKADDSSDAYFGAIIKITSAETRSDATYIAYVEYTDAEGATQYAFYDAAQTALLNTNYQSIVDSYLAAYPFAG